MNANGFLQFISTLIGGFLSAGEWLNTPLQIGELSITPLMLVSFGGLAVFVSIALIKWVIS